MVLLTNALLQYNPLHPYYRAQHYLPTHMQTVHAHQLSHADWLLWMFVWDFLWSAWDGVIVYWGSRPALTFCLHCLYQACAEISCIFIISFSAVAAVNMVFNFKNSVLRWVFSLLKKKKTFIHCLNAFHLAPLIPWWELFSLFKRPDVYFERLA